MDGLEPSFDVYVSTHSPDSGFLVTSFSVPSSRVIFSVGNSMSFPCQIACVFWSTSFVKSDISRFRLSISDICLSHTPIRSCDRYHSTILIIPYGFFSPLRSACFHTSSCFTSPFMILWRFMISYLLSSVMHVK